MIIIINQANETIRPIIETPMLQIIMAEEEGEEEVVETIPDLIVIIRTIIINNNNTLHHHELTSTNMDHQRPVVYIEAQPVETPNIYNRH